jgi:hypothetical protein
MDDKTVPHDPSADDAGEPVAALALLDLEASAGFWARVQKKINRRLTASQVVSFSWHLPQVILLELLDFAFHLFSPTQQPKGDSR